jgi:hypothetical protein
LHLGAASGLVLVGTDAYVVVDDELHLGVFDTTSRRPGRLVRLFDGVLPDGKTERKALKPDLEALCLTPPLPGAPHGALMALASGSTSQRQTGAWLPLDTTGRPVEAGATRMSLDALYAPLHGAFPDLNIEGAFVADGRLHLLQRGHAGRPDNACAVFDWGAVAAALVGHGPVPQPLRIDRFDLGLASGVPLCFTDATPLSNGSWLFCAVAEATASSYLDGACVGAAVGAVGADGRVQRIDALETAWKVEGIAAVGEGAGWRLTLVTDADDPETAAMMLSGWWA